MYIITTKNKTYTGFVAGVFFLNGVAKVDKLNDYDKLWFENLGAIVTKEDAEETPTKKSKRKKAE